MLREVTLPKRFIHYCVLDIVAIGASVTGPASQFKSRFWPRSKTHATAHLSQMLPVKGPETETEYVYLFSGAYALVCVTTS